MAIFAWQRGQSRRVCAVGVHHVHLQDLLVDGFDVAFEAIVLPLGDQSASWSRPG
jgi:hypothetical protein